MDDWIGVDMAINSGMTGLGNRRSRIAAIRALQGSGLMLYAVRRPDGRIKIGCSSDVVERLLHIRHTEILAVKQVERSEELAIHHMLAPHAVEGREVYDPAPAVLAVVNDMRTDFGLSPL